MPVREIDLSKGRINLDFGKGFYVTNIRSQAEFWAERAGAFHKTKGVVSEFEFYDNAFEYYGLNVLRFSGYTEAWLDFVMKNRDPKTPIPAHDYDIVEGPVANDDVTDRIEDYQKEIVSKADLLKELAFSKPTHQICLCTVRSLQMIELIGTTYYINVKHISKPIIGRLMMEGNFEENDAEDIFYNSNIFTQLADETSGLYEKPWQEIYGMLKKELEE